MKTALSSHSGGFRLSLHLLHVLTFRVEFCADDLHLIDCLRCVAEFAWWAETVRVGGSSKPELVDALKRQVEFDFILGTVLA